MSLRPPRTIDATQAIITGAASLEAEIMAEKAAALGRSWDAAAKALTAWRAAAPGEERTMLAYAAAEALQYLFIQRELMGLRSHADVIRQLDAPSDVLSRIGARPPTGG